MKPTNLIIAATPFFSDRGCHIRIYNQIKALEKTGEQSVLCTYHLGTNVEGVTIKRSLNIPWYRKITPGASWHKIYIDILLAWTSWRTSLRIKPQEIYAFQYEALIVAFIIKKITWSNAPIIFDCQCSLAEEWYQYNLKKYRILKPLYYLAHYLEKILLKLPTEITCSSELLKNFLITECIVDPKKLSVIYDVGQNIPNFSIEEKKKFRASLGIPDSHRIVIYSGSLTQAKGVAEYLEHIPSFLTQSPRTTFLFVGYGNLQKKYEKKYADYIAQKQIVFLGRISYFELSKYLAIADMAIDPKALDTTESSGKLYNYVAQAIPTFCLRVPNEDLKNSVTVLGSLQEFGQYLTK